MIEKISTKPDTGRKISVDEVMTMGVPLGPIEFSAWVREGLSPDEWRKFGAKNFMKAVFMVAFSTNESAILQRGDDPKLWVEYAQLLGTISDSFSKHTWEDLIVRFMSSVGFTAKEISSGVTEAVPELKFYPRQREKKVHEMFMEALKKLPKDPQRKDLN